MLSSVPTSFFLLNAGQSVVVLPRSFDRRIEEKSCRRPPLYQTRSTPSMSQGRISKKLFETLRWQSVKRYCCTLKMASRYGVHLFKRKTTFRSRQTVEWSSVLYRSVIDCRCRRRERSGLASHRVLPYSSSSSVFFKRQKV